MNFKKNDMKTFSTFTTGIILSATLMTACSKEDKMNVTPAQASHAAAKVMVQQPIQFTGGTVSATMTKLSSGDRVLIRIAEPKTIDLNRQMVRDFGVRPGQYRDVQLVMATRRLGENPSLRIRGEFNRNDGTTLPVEFVMYDVMTISTKYPTYDIVDATDFSTLLGIKQDKLSAGLTHEMLDEIQVVEGKLIISSTMNRHIYERIVTNLRDMFSIQMHEPGDLPEPVAVAPTAVTD